MEVSKNFQFGKFQKNFIWKIPECSTWKFPKTSQILNFENHHISEIVQFLNVPIFPNFTIWNTIEIPQISNFMKYYIFLITHARFQPFFIPMKRSFTFH